MWREFLDGFGNIKMCVFHGATERNIFFLMNHTGKIGAVRRINFFYKVSTVFSYRINILRSINLSSNFVLINYHKYYHLFFRLRTSINKIVASR